MITSSQHFSRIRFYLEGLVCTGLLAVSACLAGDVADDWPYYGHDAGGMRYSPLAQINRENVAELKVAWVYHAGDISDGRGRRKRSGLETTPIMVDGTLFLTTGFNRVIALEAETGKQRWSYDPKTALSWNYGDGLINRGVATWLDPSQASAMFRGVLGPSTPAHLRSDAGCQADRAGCGHGEALRGFWPGRPGEPSPRRALH